MRVCELFNSYCIENSFYTCTATSYEEDLIHRNSMQLTNVGCNGSENSLTSCCASEISSNVYCHSGAYAGVRCKLYDVIVAVYIPMHKL